MVKNKESFSGQTRMPKAPSNCCLAWPVLTNESLHGSALLFPTQLSFVSPELFFAREAAAAGSFPPALSLQLCPPHTELYLHYQADIGADTKETFQRLVDPGSS